MRRPKGVAAILRRLAAGDILHTYTHCPGYFWHGYAKQIEATPYTDAVRYAIDNGHAREVKATDGCPVHVVTCSQ
jgi:hypothetical protein